MKLKYWCVSFILVAFLLNIAECDISGCRAWAYESKSTCSLCSEVAWYLGPRPKELTTANTSRDIYSSSFKFIATGEESEMLERVFQRYKAFIFEKGEAWNELKSENSLDAIEVKVESSSQDLQVGVDESYSLHIDTASNGVITAKTVYGAMRAIESFSQLVQVSENLYTLPCTPVKITDEPTFVHRGLLVDTARHYLPLTTLERIIDSLSYAKLNVMHWHIIDSQSFPLVPKTFPQLSKGAWNSEATYTLDDVAHLVNYAKDRGVRVLMELDMPGHGCSWAAGFPNVTVECPSYLKKPNAIPLNAVSDFTLKVADSLIHDVVDVVEDHVIHLGGDEVQYKCWAESKDITEWMAAHHTSDYNDVMAYFVDHVQDTAQSIGMNVTYWQEVFTNGIKVPVDNAIIHVWKDYETIDEVVRAGYYTLMSHGWYLNHVEISWKEMLTNIQPNPDEHGKVLGGEAAIWTEYCDDTSMDQIIWPRTAAVAERLWSPAPFDTDEALARISTFRCHLVRRGIYATAVTTDFCEWVYK